MVSDILLLPVSNLIEWSLSKNKTFNNFSFGRSKRNTQVHEKGLHSHTGKNFTHYTLFCVLQSVIFINLVS